MNTYRVTVPAGGGTGALPILPNAPALLYVTIPVAFVGLTVTGAALVDAAALANPDPSDPLEAYGDPTIASTSNSVVTAVNPGGGVTSSTTASDEGFGGNIVYAGPANSVVQLALTGAAGAVQVSWTPANDQTSTSDGRTTYNVTTATLAINPTYPASYTAAQQKALAKATAASSLGHGRSASSTALLIVGGVAATGVGAAVLAGVLTDNGPGWLFGLAAESAMEASESLRRRGRRR